MFVKPDDVIAQPKAAAERAARCRFVDDDLVAPALRRLAQAIPKAMPVFDGN
jgi:hypothetical protein